MLQVTLAFTNVLQIVQKSLVNSVRKQRPFEWFPEEVSNARRDGDSNPALKQLGDTFKLKGNSFYGKMIKDLEKHTKTNYTNDEKMLTKTFRSPFFEELEIINETYEVK